MSETEISPNDTGATLQNLVSAVGDYLNDKAEFKTGVGNVEKQAKYFLDNTVEIYHKLTQLDGIVPVERVYQTDYYVIPEGVNPTFHSEYLRLREENYQELPGVVPIEDGVIARLTYKTTSESLENDVETRTVQTVDLDYTQAISILDYLTGQGVSFRKVAKERTVFRYKGLLISVDQGVQFRDESGEANLLGTGSFVEIMEDQDSNLSVEQLVSELGITSPAITEPYANVDYFVKNYRMSHDANDPEATGSVEEGDVQAFGFVDFDPINNTLTSSVDWRRVLKGIDKNQAGAIGGDEQKQQELQSALRAKLNMLISQIEENPEKGLVAILTKGGQLSGSIKYLANIDGFSNYSRPVNLLKEYATFEIRGLAHDQIQGDGVRVMLTVGRTKNGTPVFFPHKIYATKSSQDDSGKGQKGNSPAGWIERHKKRT